MSDGREVYLAWRKQSEVYRSGEKTISDAVAADKAAWAIDDDTLRNLATEGIEIVGVLVRDTLDVYITHISNFFDTAKAKIVNYESRGGALQRYLPFKFFAVKTGAAKVK